MLPTIPAWLDRLIPAVFMVGIFTILAVAFFAVGGLCFALLKGIEAIFS